MKHWNTIRFWLLLVQAGGKECKINRTLAEVYGFEGNGASEEQ